MNKIELLNQLLQLTVWLPIEGYENYEVSICGQVRNIKTKRILKQNICNAGYYIIKLYKNNYAKNYKVHRLVCKTFKPNLDNTKKCVDHVDNNKLNNTISNLRWCTHQQNQHNRQLNKNNTSGIKGITWENEKWRARIVFNNKKSSLGYFDTLEEAKIVRYQAAKQLYGEFINSCELL